MSNVTMTGNKVGPCPQCGGLGSIPDGVYDIQDDTLKVIDTGDVPPEVLQGLISLLESLRRGETTDAAVIERAEAEAPDLAPVIKSVLAKPDRLKWLGILLAIISIYQGTTAPKPPSAQQIANELRTDNIPGLVRPLAPKPKVKPKRPPKTAGKSKRNKSRKRR